MRAKNLIAKIACLFTMQSSSPPDFIALYKSGWFAIANDALILPNVIYYKHN